MNYYTYLHTPEWHVRRADALERAGHRCEECGTPYGLQVHHIDYRRLGREAAHDLMVLCRECHKRMHGCGNDAFV